MTLKRYFSCPLLNSSKGLYQPCRILIFIAILTSCCLRLEADASSSIPPEVMGGQRDPTLRLMVWHVVGLGGNAGYLNVSPKQVRFDVVWPERHKVDGSFIWPANQIYKIETVDFNGVSGLHLTLKNGQHHTLIQLNSVDPNNYNYIDPKNLALALQDFKGAMAVARAGPAPDKSYTSTGDGTASSGVATASASDAGSSSDANPADTEQTGVFVDGAKSAFAGKRLVVHFFNGCEAGAPDFQLLQQTVADQLFTAGRFTSSSGAKPELILNVTLTRLEGIDAATDAADIFGMADADAHAAAQFQLTDPGGKVIRSGTVVGHVSDAEDDDGSPHRSDAIKKLAISLGSYLAQ